MGGGSFNAEMLDIAIYAGAVIFILCMITALTLERRDFTAVGNSVFAGCLQLQDKGPAVDKSTFEVYTRYYY